MTVLVHGLLLADRPSVLLSPASVRSQVVIAH